MELGYVPATKSKKRKIPTERATVPVKRSKKNENHETLTDDFAVPSSSSTVDSHESVDDCMPLDVEMIDPEPNLNNSKRKSIIIHFIVFSIFIG